MRRTNLAVWMWAGLAWPILAAAESAFESKLSTYSWKTWVIIFGWCIGGIALRWAWDHSTWREAVKKAKADGTTPPDPPTWADMASISVIALISGVACFGVIEWYFVDEDSMPPSGIIGVAVALAAFNNKRTIVALSDAAFGVLNWAAKKKAPNDAQ